jgi:hypothetical protein
VLRVKLKDQEILTANLQMFQSLWEGGYFEGNPLHPFSESTYGSLGFMSVLHATYLVCIKPWIKSSTIALEIGPGRGAWTKALLPAQEVWAIDALTAEHNGTLKYLGNPDNFRYIHVSDFSCRELPENYFDYSFSFGCLCHIPFIGIREYAQNIFPKMKAGAHLFWMIADASKSKSAQDDYISEPSKRRYTGFENDPAVTEGGWFNIGIPIFCDMLIACGYNIVDKDVGSNLRDPIVHFMKPNNVS